MIPVELFVAGVTAALIFIVLTLVLRDEIKRENRRQ